MRAAVLLELIRDEIQGWHGLHADEAPGGALPALADEATHGGDPRILRVAADELLVCALDQQA
jgi:hypothetical protein